MKSKTEQGQPNEPLISQDKAAEMCGVTRAALRKLVKGGRLRSLEVGGRDLVYLKEVEEFEAAQRKAEGQG